MRYKLALWFNKVEKWEYPQLKCVENRLAVFPVTYHRPSVHYYCQYGESQYLRSDTLQVAATHEDGADGIDKIMYRVDVSGEIRPIGHRAHGGKQTTHQHEYQHEEPHHENRLLHSLVVIGDDESETAKDECQ